MDGRAWGIGRVADLVAKTLGGDDGDFIAYALVGLEVESELWVVAFDDDFGRFLDGLSRLERVSLDALYGF